MRTILVTFSLLICIHGLSIGQEPSEAAAIAFEDTVHHFGSVLEGEDVKHTFTFTNTSGENLTLFSVKGSCGCVVPKYPKKPIASGENGVIEVVFHTKLKTGKRRQLVYVVANTEPPQSIITLEGEVRDNKNIERNNTDPALITLVPDTLTEAYMEAIDCVSIYPNPATDRLTLNIAELSDQPAEVKIFSKAGRLVERRTLYGEMNESTLHIDLVNYPNGHYIATIQIRGEWHQAKCFLVAHD